MSKFFKVVIVIACIVCIGFDIGYFYIKKNLDKHFTLSTQFVTGNHFATEEDLENDKDIFYNFVVNYYANKDNSGEELFELKINSYTDKDFKGMTSYGIQVVNPSSMVLMPSIKMDSNFTSSTAYYSFDIAYNKSPTFFNQTDGIAYKASQSIPENDASKWPAYVCNIDKVPYAYDFKFEYKEKVSQFLWVSSYDVYTSNYKYFMYQVFEAAKSAITKDGKTEGIFTDLNLEFNDVFNFYKYNSATGKFDYANSAFGYDKRFFAFKIYKYNTGAKVHTQSMFGSIGSADESQGGLIWESMK
ncbi:MAG: hypothetical protein E7378_03155 [Clostridiales bacterium]|nr:hypothetical protein [Clostridiales bacterium]